MAHNSKMFRTCLPWRFFAPATASDSTPTTSMALSEFLNPNFLMLHAASKSLSCSAPHTAHVQTRSFSVKAELISPQVQVFELGSNRPILTRFLPFHSHLYSNCLQPTIICKCFKIPLRHHYHVLFWF